MDQNSKGGANWGGDEEEAVLEGVLTLCSTERRGERGREVALRGGRGGDERGRGGACSWTKASCLLERRTR